MRVARSLRGAAFQLSDLISKFTCPQAGTGLGGGEGRQGAAVRSWLVWLVVVDCVTKGVVAPSC